MTTDTQAEDTALLIEMDNQVKKRVNDCIHDLLTNNDDLANYFMTGLIHHPKTATLIRERVKYEMQRMRDEEMLYGGAPGSGRVSMGIMSGAKITMGTAGGAGAISSNSLQNAYNQQYDQLKVFEEQIRAQRAVTPTPAVTDTVTKLTKQQERSFIDRIINKK